MINDDYWLFYHNLISFSCLQACSYYLHLHYLPITPSAFIESVQTACANGREVGGASETPLWRPPLTTITVSKKRNWLQQSSLGKNHCTKDELQGMLGAEEEGSQGSHQPPTSPSPSPDQIRPSGGASSRHLHLHLPQVSLDIFLLRTSDSLFFHVHVVDFKLQLVS